MKIALAVRAERGTAERAGSGLHAPARRRRRWGWRAPFVVGFVVVLVLAPLSLPLPLLLPGPGSGAASLQLRTASAAPPVEGRASGAATPAEVSSAEAQSIYVRGLGRYAVRDLDRAIADFEAAFGLEARPEYLFAEAQALRLKGSCPRAVELYRRFLATRPPPIQVQATELGLERCASVSVPVPVPVPVSASRSSPARSSVAARPPSAATASRLTRIVHDPFAVASLSGALLALGTGAGAWVASNHARPPEIAATTTSYDTFARAWQTAEARRALAIGALASAAALGVMGGLRAWWLLRDAGGAGSALEGSSHLVFDGRGLMLAGEY